MKRESIAEINEININNGAIEMSVDNTSSEQFYIKLGNPKKVAEKSILLALTIANDLQPVIISGVAMSWTKQAISVLSNIHQAATEERIKNLPYASLRGLLQVGVTNLARLHTDIGLNFKYLNSPKDPEPFGYIVDTDERAIQKTLRPLLNDWITNYLKPFADRGDVPSVLLDRLENLRDRNELIELSNIQSQVLPWLWNEETGTTDPKDKYAFSFLVDLCRTIDRGSRTIFRIGRNKASYF
jgi:pPIWI_RE module N-terminal domain